MKTAIQKVTLVGRATVFAVGLAVVLALGVGLATTALAAVPGDPFRLGQTNVVGALTTLAGNRAGPMLVVDNNSAAAGARALDLRVEPGKAPMVVGSSTRVPNLNADKVDGKDADAFFSGETYVNTNPSTGSGGGSNKLVVASCDSGDRILGGGGTSNDTQDDQLLTSVPAGQGWAVLVSDNNSASRINATAVCADFPPLRQE